MTAKISHSILPRVLRRLGSETPQYTTMPVKISSSGKTHNCNVGLSWPRKRSPRMLPNAAASAPVQPKLTAYNSDNMLVGRTHVTPGIVGRKLVAHNAAP